MNLIVKQLLITLILSIILTAIHYFNLKNNVKDVKTNFYLKLLLTNFIFINVAFFAGYKLFNESGPPELNMDDLEVQGGEPDF